MEWLKTLAPLLGTALGGPIGAAAAGFLADKLGIKESTVSAVSDVLNSGKMGADQIAAIKLAEIDFQKFLEDNKIQLETIHAGDRNSARQREMAVRDKTPAILAGLITVGFFGVLSFMLAHELPVAGRDALLVMLGALGSAWAGVCSYYFGSSAGSQAKNATLDRLTSK